MGTTKLVNRAFKGALSALGAFAAAMACGDALAQGPAALPPVDLTYDIDVDVDPETGAYSGVETVVWRNGSDETVRVAPFHLYLNGFSNGSATWLQESSGALRSFAAEDDQRWGYTEPTAIRQIAVGADDPEAREAAELSWSAVQPDDGNVWDRSVIEVALARPVAPGETLTLEIAFEGVAPGPPVARTGCAVDAPYCFFGQWFPQLVARGPDNKGWVTAQFHAATEFYADFADFEVSIAAPADMMIAATGRRVDDAPLDDGRRRVIHRQRAVHNFAFAVLDGADFIDRHQPVGDGPAVDLRLVWMKGRPVEAERLTKTLKATLDLFSARIGPYPYDVLTVVYPPVEGAASGGMEYPTLFTGVIADPILIETPLRSVKLLDLVDIHEFGHQYFQGVLANDERVEAYLDEGFNSYWEEETLEALFGEDATFGTFLGRKVDGDALEAFFGGDGPKNYREALAKRPSWLFARGTSGGQIYNRPAATLRTARNLFGTERLDVVFQEYYARYAFKHPTGADFLAVVDAVGGADMAAFFRESFYQPRSPDYAVSRARSRKASTPPGRYVTPSGPLLVRDKPDDDDGAAMEAFQERWLAETLAAYGGPASDSNDNDDGDRDGESVTARVRDPGWTDIVGSRDGSVFAEPLTTVQAGAVGDADAVYQHTVEVSGSGWRELPVSVQFTFANGAVLTAEWDGRAAWRRYEFFYPSRLVSAEIDPDDRIVIDADPENDVKRLEADETIARKADGWGAAAASFLALMANGALAWL
ncbi:MAG: M1 family metallopeptidase [Pseudomonadota bacterium]